MFAQTKICVECARNQKLKFLPCEHHAPAVAANTCEHKNTSVIYVHNGTGIHCHECNSIISLQEWD